MKIDIKNLGEYDVDGIDTRDYPDFCDAYISWAVWKDGTELTDAELDALNDDHRDFIHEAVYDRLF
jgi:hypothetical protein